MTQHHHHHAGPHAHRAVAARPTFSLLRLSAAERLACAAAPLGVLWLFVYLILA